MKTETSPNKVSTLFCLRLSARRRFRLAAILFTGALMASGPVQIRANNIVFDTFGPGDTYDQLNGRAVGFQVSNGGPFFEIAAQFTALTSGVLQTVNLGLTFVSLTTPGSTNVFLYGDAAGLPDNADQALLGTVTPTSFPNLVSLAVAGGPSVVQGSLYWLVVKPSNPLSQHTIWNLSSPPVTGSNAFTTNDSTWQLTTNPTTGRVLPAFSIIAQPAPTPDSGSTLLLVLVSIPALLVLERVLQNKRKLLRTNSTC